MQQEVFQVKKHTLSHLGKKSQNSLEKYANLSLPCHEQTTHAL